MKACIVGAGLIVNDLMSFIHEIESFEIEAICGTVFDEKRMNELSSAYKIPKIYTDFDEMLKDESIELLYLGVPNHLHYPMAKKGLLAHKNVIVEKPFTSNHKEALDLQKIALETGKIIIEGVSTRFIPNFLKIKESLPLLGDIKIVTTNYSQYSRRYDAFKKGEITPAFNPKMSGGALLDLNIYNLNFICALFGEPKHIDYFANIEYGIDTSGVLNLDYGSFKCVCTGAKDCKAPLFSSIQGDEANITITSSLNIISDFKLTYNSEGGQMTFNDKGEVINLNQGKHRMYHEFVEMMRIILEKDMKAANAYLDLSVLTMKVQTIARQKAGIVFAAD